MAYFGQYCCQIRLSGLRYGLKVAHLTQSSIVELAGQTATNPGIAWDCLRGQILDSRFQAGDLVQSGRNGAWLRARDLEESAEVILFLENEAEPSAAHDLDRFREAAFLSHPNLVRVLGAGRAACGDRNFIYIATETGQCDLAEELQRRPMTVDEAADLLRQLASGLTYLHTENLACCAVRAGAIWRVNSQWKLADYAQLRVPGQYPVQETRRLLPIPAFECPPEAHEGLVSPAWDVWSVGSVLRKVFPRSGRAQSVPPPFGSIVSAALDPNPNARPSLDAMLHELSAHRSAAVHGLPQPMAAILPDEPVPALEPEHSLAREAGNRSAFRDHRVPVIAGAFLAAAIAGVLTLAPPIRTVRQDTVHTSAPPPAAPPLPAPVNQPEAREPERQSPSGGTKVVSPAGSDVEKAISTVLNRWVDAKRHGNLEEEMGCYAPFVDRFYKRRGLPAGQLRREEQDVLSRSGTVQRFDISNVKFNRVNSQWAVVSFDKKWDLRGRTRSSGSSRDEFVMRPVNGQWKISSQREVKVYGIDKQPTNSKEPI
jgi:hypothetical protein